MVWLAGNAWWKIDSLISWAGGRTEPWIGDTAQGWGSCGCFVKGIQDPPEDPPGRKRILDPTWGPWVELPPSCPCPGTSCGNPLQRAWQGTRGCQEDKWNLSSQLPLRGRVQGWGRQDCKTNLKFIVWREKKNNPKPHHPRNKLLKLKNQWRNVLLAAPSPTVQSTSFLLIKAQPGEVSVAGGQEKA